MVADFLALTVTHCVARSLACSFFKNLLERLERFQRLDDHSETENGLVKLNILNVSSEIKCSEHKQTSWPIRIMGSRPPFNRVKRSFYGAGSAFRNA